MITKVTLKDIANELGITETAVSFALNGKRGVSEETRRRVKEVAERYGYTPNHMARSLVSQQSKTIGLIVPDIVNPYYGKMVREINESAKQLGFSLILAISDEDAATEKEQVYDFLSKQVDGIIISPVNRQAGDLSHFDMLQKRSVPVIQIASFYPGVKAPFVMVDIEQGARLITDYLIRSGRQNILFVTGPRDSEAYRQRVHGYRRALEENNIPFTDDSIVVANRVNFDLAVVAAQTILQKDEPVDAIMTVSDFMAVGVLNTLLEHNISVPGEVAVTGFDDVIYSTIASIPITTVAQDIEKMSSLTVKTLVAEINDRKGAMESILLEPRLCIRKSTG